MDHWTFWPIFITLMLFPTYIVYCSAIWFNFKFTGHSLDLSDNVLHHWLAVNSDSVEWLMILVCGFSYKKSLTLYMILGPLLRVVCCFVAINTEWVVLFIEQFLCRNCQKVYFMMHLIIIIYAYSAQKDTFPFFCFTFPFQLCLVISMKSMVTLTTLIENEI